MALFLLKKLKGENIMKFNIENYEGNYAMHCKTEEEAKTFCWYLNNLGRTWCDGTNYLCENEWSVYDDQTCYAFNENKYGWKSLYERENAIILEFSDFDWNENETKDMAIVLIYTNGYYTSTFTDFANVEEARARRKEEYKSMIPTEGLEPEWDETSFCGEEDAILYANGENVHIWKIVCIKIDSIGRTNKK